jgi:hypothetical protein
VKEEIRPWDIEAHIESVKNEFAERQKEYGLRGMEKETGVSASTLSRFMNGKEILLSNFVSICVALNALYESPE